MVGVRRGAFVLAIVVSVQLVSTVPAYAAGSVTVTPSTNLADRQTVTVAGSGWDPALEPHQVCEAIASATPSTADCGHSAFFTLTASGDFSIPFGMHESEYIPSLDRYVDCATENICVIDVFEDESGATAQTAPLTSWVHVQPDCRIRRLSDSAILFDNVYFAARRDTPEWNIHTVTAGTDWSFALQFQNDGDSNDALTITARTADNYRSPDITVRYFWGWHDVTAEVSGTGFTFGNLAPGAFGTMSVQFRAAAGAPVDAKSHQFVVAKSHGVRVDAMKVGVVVAP